MDNINLFTNNLKILCIGDVILDCFSSNNLIKLSDEEPVHVVKEVKNTYKLGGAGNVAENLVNAGCNVHFVTIGCKDEYFTILKKLLKDKNVKSKIFYIKKNTTFKKRFYVENYHLLRQDEESVDKIKKNTAEKILTYLKKIIDKNNFDAILVSDYGKGLITEYFFKKLVFLAKRKKLKIFTDPKSKNLSLYNGSYLLKANKKEINDHLSEFNLKIDDIIVKKKQICNVLKKLKIKNLIITRSSQSTIFFHNTNSKLYFVEVDKLEIINTTGAGDTFFSFFLIYFLQKNNFLEAIKFGNKFASFVATKFGTYAPSVVDILLNVLKNKLFFLNENKSIIKNIVSNIKKNNYKIGFANGCFDILHAGHINLLKIAKSKCDFLIVGLNNDLSVKKNKGRSRPYNNIETRSLIMSSLNFVDLVFVFNEKTPINLIKIILPDIIFKGSDYKRNQIIGLDVIKKNNGKIEIIQNYKKFSSTEIIHKILK